MSIETIIPTPRVAEHRKYRVSEYSVLDITDPDNLQMPSDTDNVPLSGFVLRTGINQTFPTNINHRAVAPLSDMFGFVNAFKNKDHKRCRTHINGIAKGVAIKQKRATKISPICASERGTEYAFFSVPGIIDKIQRQARRKVVFLNPSRGSVERASRFGLKFNVIMTVQDVERRRVIYDICREKGWKVYTSKPDDLTNKYVYYVSYHPQVAIANGLKYFFGFKPNAGKTVFFRRDVVGVERQFEDYTISYDKIDYVETYTYDEVNDLTTIPCDVLSDFFSMNAKKRKIGASGSPGYDSNIILYHDLILSFKSSLGFLPSEPLSGVCIPLHTKYLIASDIEVTETQILGDVGEGKCVLDDLRVYPNGTAMLNKEHYNYDKDWFSLMNKATFMRTPFSGHPVFLGFKYKYYKDKIYDIFFDKGEIVRFDPRGSIVCDGKNYSFVSDVTVPYANLLGWYACPSIAYSEYDEMINRHDVSYGVNFMSQW